MNEEIFLDKQYGGLPGAAVKCWCCGNWWNLSSSSHEYCPRCGKGSTLFAKSPDADQGQKRNASPERHEMMEQHKCHRCGRCCLHMHSSDNGMPCEKLAILNGVATCLIYEIRRDVCKAYPPGDELCWFEKGTR